MTSFVAAVAEVLQERGPLEVFTLAAVARKLRPVRKNELSLGHEIFKFAKRGEHGLQIVEYPSYQLNGSVPKTLPRGRYVRCAVETLAERGCRLGLDELAAHYSRRYGRAAVAPEFWMFAMLRSEGRRLITQMGQLRIGLKPHAKPVGIAARGPRGAPRVESERVEPIHEKIHEKNLESLVSERLEEIEPGLYLVQRQYATPVGRIDLLCRDRRGNFVVIELKRFRASTESIIDQVTRYMGWVQEQLAKRHQHVRGYIVVGKLDRKLQYSVRAIENLKVKCFRVSLTDPD
jgi:Holliday junction resolvase-like predicted endonuclease